MDIRSDRQKVLSYVELGKKYHMDPRTAKRYAQSPQKPEYTLSQPTLFFCKETLNFVTTLPAE